MNIDSIQVLLDKADQILKAVDFSAGTAFRYGPFYFTILFIIFGVIILFAMAWATKNIKDKDAIIDIRRPYIYWSAPFLFGGVFLGLTASFWYYVQDYNNMKSIISSVNELNSEVIKLKSKIENMRYTAIGYIDVKSDLK